MKTSVGDRWARLTWEITDEKGRPWSRAKDHVCRETVATVLMQADVMLTIKIEVMMIVPALLCVALKKAWMNG